jgi:hypothetical protein
LIPLSLSNAIVTLDLRKTWLASGIHEREFGAATDDVGHPGNWVLTSCEDGATLDRAQVCVRWDVDADWCIGYQAIASQTDRADQPC